MKKKVLLGMSGGLDSSVAAFLLQKEGYEVTGVTFRFYEPDGNTEYLDRAARLARQMEIPHIIGDYRALFKQEVITYFVDEYKNGRTPVPCTYCNSRLKWRLLAQIADRHQIDFLSTGHYVRLIHYQGDPYITVGDDPDKDQSFFLWGLSRSILNRIVFPLGGCTKQKVREIAISQGFQSVLRPKESMGVCFCPGDYRSFLKSVLANGEIRPGHFRDLHGQILGKHQGYLFYTVGQRRGLGINFQRPTFVQAIIPERNEVILAPLEELYHTRIYLKECNFINRDRDWVADGKTICKIRYRKQATLCNLSLAETGETVVSLLEPLHAIAEGQAAAFYRNERLIGGGIITGKT